MAKDPAFLFYDGDAAKDVSHMNRLERGCYFDLIQAQRKFGRLTEDLVKKILGRDYETCWESVKICLTYDNHMYFIEWLEESAIKRKEYSESRKRNKMGHKKEHMSNICKTYDNHMENVNVNEDYNKELLEQICVYGQAKEIKKEICEDYFHHYEKKDWIDGNGIKITNWKSGLINWNRKQITVKDEPAQKKQEPQMSADLQSIKKKMMEKRNGQS